MSDRPPFGSLENPVRLDLWQRIVEVGWSTGGVVIVEAEYIAGLDRPDINVLVPDNYDDHGVNSTDLEVFGPEDYADWFVVKFGDDHVIDGELPWQDEITDVWIWDARYIGVKPESTPDPDREQEINDAAVANGNAAHGPFKLHYAGAQVRWDVKALGRPMLGDWVEHTHPNGSKVTFAQGATPLSAAYVSWLAPWGTDWPGGYAIDPSEPGGYPEPPADLSNSLSWYWYRLGTIPGQKVSRVRRSWLVHFDKEHVQVAELAQKGFQSTYTLTYRIKGYPAGTSFEVSADKKVTPVPVEGVPVEPIFSVEETVPGTLFGTLKKFGPKGVLA